MEAFERMRSEKRGLVAGFKEILSALSSIPATMKQLAVVQFFTWLGLFCMWMFFGLMTSYSIFGASDRRSALFRQGNEWGGIAFMVYNVVTFAVAFVLPKLAAKFSRKKVHAAALLCGGIGLLSTHLIGDKYVLLLTMVGVGIAWASILSMPYAILSGALPPARMGVFMGVFNFFIVIPEIIASTTFGRIIRAVFGESSTVAPLYVVMAGGGFMIIAALACVMLVRDLADLDVPEEAVFEADQQELFTIPESAQPVPSTGLIDEADPGPKRR
jgi:maltose/moltooligosaccharide transporter